MYFVFRARPFSLTHGMYSTACVPKVYNHVQDKARYCTRAMWEKKNAFLSPTWPGYEVKIMVIRMCICGYQLSKVVKADDLLTIWCCHFPYSWRWLTYNSRTSRSCRKLLRIKTAVLSLTLPPFCLCICHSLVSFKLVSYHFVSLVGYVIALLWLMSPILYELSTCLTL